jgi:hypothetical protein
MTECPNCHKIITDPGYEFGTEFKMRCLTCSCGTHVIVNADPTDVLERKLRKLKRKKG